VKTEALPDSCNLVYFKCSHTSDVRPTVTIYSYRSQAEIWWSCVSRGNSHIAALSFKHTVRMHLALTVHTRMTPPSGFKVHKFMKRKLFNIEHQLKLGGTKLW